MEERLDKHAGWFELAERLGTPVSELLVKMSHREFRCWMLKLSRDRDIPSNTDWYIMKVALEVRRILYALSNNKSPIKLGDFILPTLKTALKEAVSEPESPEVQEARIQQSKSFWKSLVEKYNDTN